MNSKITQKTYDEFTTSVDKKDLIIKPFYISRKKGTVLLEVNKFKDNVFCFSWDILRRNKYTEYCGIKDMYDREYSHDHCFEFSSFEELSEKLAKEYVCPYHANCCIGCSVNRITSPIDKCSICLREEQMHMLEETQCGHLFCLSCLDKYVKTRLNFLDDEDRECIVDEGIPCPVCRRDINLCSECNHANFECSCE